MSKKIKSYLIYLSVTLGAVAVDYISKVLAKTFLYDQDDVRLIPYIFNLTYLENKGAAWGMFADKRWIFMIISTVAIIAMLFIQFKYADAPKMFCIPLAFVIGGGIGNMIDRIFSGYVVDFIQFDFYKDFPVFNVADMFVTVGTVLLGIYLIFFDKVVLVSRKEEKENDGES